MGITGLLSYIKKKIPGAVRRVPLATYAGKRVAVEVSIYMYKFLTSRDHVGGFAKLASILLQNGISPVFVMDGAPPEEKGGTLDERKAIYESAVKRRDELRERVATMSKSPYSTLAKEDRDLFRELKRELVSFENRTLRPTAAQFREVAKLMELMGLPCLRAHSEAEWLCAKLAREGLVTAVMTEDSDILPNGAERMLSLANLDILGGEVVEYSLPTILESTGLTFDQFVDVAVMAGCDYLREGLRGVGVIKGVSLMKKYGSIEGLLANPPKGIVPSEEFLAGFARARAIFHESPDPPPIALLDPGPPPDRKALEEFVRTHSRSHGAVTCLGVLWKPQEPLDEADE